MLRNIYLHRKVAELFGPVYRLDVASAAEAGQALAAIVPDFRAYAVGQHFRVVRGERDTGMAFDQGELGFQLGHVDLHIVPVLSGAGNRGLGKIAAVMFPVATIGIGGSTIGGAMKGLGVAMALLGLGQMLSPSPKSRKQPF